MKRKISLILVLSMLLSAMSFQAICVSAQETQTFNAAEVLDVFQDVADYGEAKYPGAYTDANLSYVDTDKGVYAMTYLKNSAFDGRMCTIEEARKLYTDGKNVGCISAAETQSAKYYATSKDNANRFESQVTDIRGVAKDAWHGARYWRGDKNAFKSPGIGFGITDNSYITADDTNLTVIVEYLDNGTDNINIRYWINDGTEKGALGASTLFTTKTNTGKWKVAYMSLTNAKFLPITSTDTNTGLCMGTEDFILTSSSDLYISRIMIVKTEDVLLSQLAKDMAVTNVTHKYDGINNIQTSVDVTSEAASNATLYTAVYDSENNLYDVVASSNTTIAAGATVTLTTNGYVNIPDYDNYTFRKYIWTSELTPYVSDTEDNLFLAADGSDRRAVLRWKNIENQSDDVEYYVYRNGGLIAITQNIAYIDETVSAGEITYQVVARSNGEELFRSNYAIATVTDITTDTTVAYTKACAGNAGVNQISSNTCDINNGMYCNRENSIYTREEAQKLYKNGADIFTEATVPNGYYVILKSGSTGTRTETLTDINGVAKDAWVTAPLKRLNSAPDMDGDPTAEFKGDATNWKDIPTGHHIVFTVDDDRISALTAEGNSTVTIFVEYLSDTNNNIDRMMFKYKKLTVNEETGGTTESSPEVTAAAMGNLSSYGVTGTWNVASATLSNVSLAATKAYPYSLYLHGRNAEAVPKSAISSVFITSKTGDEAIHQYLSYRDSNFGSDYRIVANNQYADGVSVDYSSDNVEAVATTYAKSKDEVSNIVTLSSGDGLSTVKYASDADCIAEVSANDETRKCISTTDSLYFDVSDTYLRGCEDAIIELSYLQNFAGTIRLHYKKYNEETKTYVSTITPIAEVNEATGTWATARLVINDFAFMDTDSACTDFKLSVTSEDEAFAGLNISSVSVKNISHLQ